MTSSEQSSEAAGRPAGFRVPVPSSTDSSSSGINRAATSWGAESGKQVKDFVEDVSHRLVRFSDNLEGQLRDSMSNMMTMMRRMMTSIEDMRYECANNQRAVQTLLDLTRANEMDKYKQSVDLTSVYDKMTSKINELEQALSKLTLKTDQEQQQHHHYVPPAAAHHAAQYIPMPMYNMPPPPPMAQHPKSYMYGAGMPPPAANVHMMAQQPGSMGIMQAGGGMRPNGVPAGMMMAYPSSSMVRQPQLPPSMAQQRLPLAPWQQQQLRMPAPSSSSSAHVQEEGDVIGGKTRRCVSELDSVVAAAVDAAAAQPPLFAAAAAATPTEQVLLPSLNAESAVGSSPFASIIKRTPEGTYAVSKPLDVELGGDDNASYDDEDEESDDDDDDDDEYRDVIQQGVDDNDDYDESDQLSSQSPIKHAIPISPHTGQINIFGASKPSTNASPKTEPAAINTLSNFAFGSQSPKTSPEKPKEAFKSIFGESTSKCIFGSAPPPPTTTTSTAKSATGDKPIFGFKLDSFASPTPSIFAAPKTLDANKPVFGSKSVVFDMPSPLKLDSDTPTSSSTVESGAPKPVFGTAVSLGKVPSIFGSAATTRSDGQVPSTAPTSISSFADLAKSAEAKTNIFGQPKSSSGLPAPLFGSAVEGSAVIGGNNAFSQKAQPLFGQKMPTSSASTPTLTPMSSSAQPDSAEPTGAGAFRPDDYKPVLSLPSEVETCTGEEKHEVLFHSDCAILYKFESSVKPEWKECGRGNVKVSIDDKRKYRLIFRREQVLKIAANHSVDQNVKFIIRNNRPNCLCWFAMDFATDPNGKMEKFCIRFKNSTDPFKFIKAVAQSGAEVPSVPEVCDVNPTSSQATTTTQQQ